MSKYHLHQLSLHEELPPMHVSLLELTRVSHKRIASPEDQGEPSLLRQHLTKRVMDGETLTNLTGRYAASIIGNLGFVSGLYVHVSKQVPSNNSVICRATIIDIDRIERQVRLATVIQLSKGYEIVVHAEIVLTYYECRLLT